MGKQIRSTILRATGGTAIYGLDDAGDIAILVVLPSGGVSQGFVVPSNSINSTPVDRNNSAGTGGTVVYGINNKGQDIAGPIR